MFGVRECGERRQKTGTVGREERESSKTKTGEKKFARENSEFGGNDIEDAPNS
jgi:hypothetical protein